METPPLRGTLAPGVRAVLERLAAGRMNPRTDESQKLGQDLTAKAIALLKEWA